MDIASEVLLWMCVVAEFWSLTFIRTFSLEYWTLWCINFHYNHGGVLINDFNSVSGFINF